jgi:hypothetical protein
MSDERNDRIYAGCQTTALWQSMHAISEFMGGEPPHEMFSSVNNRPVEVVLLCIECIDEISAASWNDEEWGPYPSRLQNRRETGRA